MLPVPFQAPVDADADKRRGEQKDRIVQMMARVDDEVFGGEGSFEQGIVRVPRDHLWTNPIYPIEFSEDEISAMRESLRTQGQREPITVYKARDPRKGAEGTGGQYLIVDLDGELLWLAAGAIYGMDVLRVRFMRYPTLYHAAQDTLVLAATRHRTTDREFETLFLRARWYYDALEEQGISLPSWPKQEEWAAYLGKSQSTISRWTGMSDSLKDPQIREAVDSGKLTLGQLRETVDLPSPERRVAAAAIVERNVARGDSGPIGRTETRKVVRGVAQSQQRHVTPRYAASLSDTPIHPPRDLWIPDLVNYPSPTAIGALIHDLTLWLEQTQATRGKLDVDAQALLNALQRETLQEHVRQVTASFLTR